MLLSRPASGGRLERLPLLLPAAAVCLGIVISWQVSLNEWLWLGGCVLGAALAIVFSFRPHRRLMAHICLCASLMFLGGGRFDQSYRTIAKDDLVTFTAQDPIPATITGCVSTYPLLVDSPKELGYRSLPTVKFLLDVESVKTAGGYVPASGICRVTVREPYNYPAPGDRVEMVGFLGRYRQADNPGQFDALAQARLTGTFAWFTVPTSRGVTVLNSAPSGLFNGMWWRVKSAVRQRLTETGDLQSGMLLSALLLGERHPALQNLNRIMMRAGVAHFLSISGLHLGIFLGFVYLLCRLFMIGPRAAAVVVLVALAWYLCFAEARAPLLRSAIMAACIAGGLAVGRRYSPVNALAAALIILLVIDPRQLLMPGFQLSFAIVLGLILFTVRFRTLMFGWWLRRRGLKVFTEKQWLRKWMNFQLADAAMNFFSVSVCAYLISVPLAAVHFGFFSPYGMVLGLVLFPIIVAILIPGYVAMALALPMPNLASRFADLAGWFAGMMADLMQAADKLPLLSVTMRPVGKAWVLCYYAALLSILFIRGGWWRKPIAICVVAVFIGMTVFTQLPAPVNGDVQLNFLSIGYGQFCVMRLPDGRTWLVDAGSRSQADVYYRVYLPFLRAARLPKPQAAILSHPHPDHYNVMTEIFEKDGFTDLCISYACTGAEGFGKDSRLLDMFKKLHPQVQHYKKFDRNGVIPSCPDVKIEVLWPSILNESYFCNLTTDLTNETSMVLKITCGGKSALLPGDIQELAQKILIEMKGSEKLKADILVLPHHGGWDATLPAFVAAVDPKVIIVSSAEVPAGPAAGPKSGREFFEKLTRRKGFFCTALDGAVTVDFGPDGIFVKTAASPRAMRF